MRLMMTAVSPAAGIRVDVLLDADPQTPAGEVAAELGALLHGGPAGDLAPARLSAVPAGPGAAPAGLVPANVIRFPSARPDDRGMTAPQPDPGPAAGGTAVLALRPDGPGRPAGSRGNGSHRSGAPVLYVDGRAVPPGQPIADSPLRPGCVVSLGDPSGCLPPEPTGIVEVRVTSGP